MIADVNIVEGSIYLITSIIGALATENKDLENEFKVSCWMGVVRHLVAQADTCLTIGFS